MSYSPIIQPSWSSCYGRNEGLVWKLVISSKKCLLRRAWQIKEQCKNTGVPLKKILIEVPPDLKTDRALSIFESTQLLPPYVITASTSYSIYSAISAPAYFASRTNFGISCATLGSINILTLSSASNLCSTVGSIHKFADSIQSSHLIEIISIFLALAREINGPQGLDAKRYSC